MENDKNILCHINWFEDNIKITHKNIFSSFITHKEHNFYKNLDLVWS